MDFEQAITAAGSEPLTLPFIPHADPRIVDSTGALELNGIPGRLLAAHPASHHGHEPRPEDFFRSK